MSARKSYVLLLDLNLILIPLPEVDCTLHKMESVPRNVIGVSRAYGHMFKRSRDKWGRACLETMRWCLGILKLCEVMGSNGGI